MTAGKKLMPNDGSISLDFGVALEALKNGKKIWRHGWNKNTIRVMMIAVPFADVQAEFSLGIPVMLDADGKLLDYWHPSPTDLFAEDWHFE